MLANMQMWIIPLILLLVAIAGLGKKGAVLAAAYIVVAVIGIPTCLAFVSSFHF